MKKYPNLAEAAPYWNMPYFANITPELLNEVLAGNEELTATEALNMCRYSEIPYSVLFCPKLIMLDAGRPKHQNMVNDLLHKVHAIKEWEKKGSHEASIYMTYGRRRYVELWLNFMSNKKVSYCRYLGVKKEIDDTLLFIKVEQNKINNKPRGVRRSAL